MIILSYRTKLKILSEMRSHVFDLRHQRSRRAAGEGSGYKSNLGVTFDLMAVVILSHKLGTVLNTPTIATAYFAND